MSGTRWRPLEAAVNHLDQSITSINPSIFPCSAPLRYPGGRSKRPQHGRDGKSPGLVLLVYWFHLITGPAGSLVLLVYWFHWFTGPTVSLVPRVVVEGLPAVTVRVCVCVRAGESLRWAQPGNTEGGPHLPGISGENLKV